MQQHALIAIDIGQARQTGPGRPIAGIECEHAGLAIQLADIKDIRADGAAENGQRNAAAAFTVRQGDCLLGVGIFGHACPRFDVTVFCENASDTRPGGARYGGALD